MVEPALAVGSSNAVKSVLSAIYHIRCDTGAVEARAKAIAVEQSVEMPVEAIDDGFVLGEILGRVEGIKELAAGLFEVRIALAAATVGRDAGQFLNMLFGNTSLHEDIVLHDFVLPPDLEASFGGPRHGLEGLRARVGAGKRALTCSALKPQGLPLPQLGELARRFADGGVDYIKDDHGFADQAYAPFAARVAAIVQALRGIATTHYVPSLSGDLDTMRRQIAIAADAGIACAMVAPMIMGAANFHRLVHDHPDFAFVAHPSLAGASRIAPAPLFGKLFRALGADALVFPNHGGRFGYTPETCATIARYAREDRNGLKAALPVPAGGLGRERVPELLDFYGPDVMLLIGGALIAARNKLTEAAADFVAAVKAHPYE
jgi:ribulose-bisphosphate carboxylase large chain